MGCQEKRLVGLAAVIALSVILLPRPARAHDGHGSVALVIDEPTGPFTVTVWAVEHELDRTLEIYVLAESAVAPRTVEVADDQGRVTQLLSLAANGAWTGVMRRPASGTGSLDIHVADGIGQVSTLSVSVLETGVPGMSLIVSLLMVQAVTTSGWLLL